MEGNKIKKEVKKEVKKEELDKDELMKLLNSANDMITDLTAKVESLEDSLNKEDAETKKMQEELKEAKKLNYSLSRMVNTKPAGNFEKTLMELYGRREKKNE